MSAAFCSGSRVGCDAFNVCLVFDIAAALIELPTDKIDFLIAQRPQLPFPNNLGQ
jgi:hypothetical protein